MCRDMECWKGVRMGNGKEDGNYEGLRVRV